MNIERVLYEPEHKETLLTLYEYARCCEGPGDRDEAIRLMTHAQQVDTELHGAEHPDTIKSARRLALWKSEKEKSSRDSSTKHESLVSGSHYKESFVEDEHPISLRLEPRKRPAENQLLAPETQSRKRADGPDLSLAVNVKM